MAQPEFGATAWGRAWLRTIERTNGGPNPQLPKARSLARNQKATLTLAAETITATVLDGAASHNVSIPIERWSDTEQAAAEPILAGQTDSVVGDLPDQLLDTLTKAGVPIAVPIADIAATCTCRSRTKLCAHILTALYGLVLLVDERPATALEIRANSLVSGPPADPDWVPLSAIRPEHFYTTATA